MPRRPRSTDVPPALVATIRAARQARTLSQVDLARALGLHQRQISDLERGVTDSRLSTVQNIARALDLELMLVPRHLITTVESLGRAGRSASARPLYSLDDEPELEVAERELR